MQLNEIMPEFLKTIEEEGLDSNYNDATYLIILEKMCEGINDDDTRKALLNIIDEKLGVLLGEN